MGNNQRNLYSPDYALSQYDKNTAPLKDQILSDTNIDNISRQELLDQIDRGRSSTASANTDNADTYTDITNKTILSVQGQEKLAQGDDPLHRGRRFVQDAFTAMATQPGRRQTMLTANDATPTGSPTLLTAAIPATGGGSGGS